MNILATDAHAMADGRSVPTAKLVTERAAEHVTHPTAQPSQTPAPGDTIGLFKLPAELISSVAAHLLPSDFRALRLVSRSMRDIINCQILGITVDYGDELRLLPKAFPNLERVDLRNCKPLRYRQLGELTKLSRLQKLDLGFNRALGDRSMAQIARCKKLKILNIANGKRINRPGLARLQALTRLKALDLSMYFHLTDESFTSFQWPPNLEDLDLTHTTKITHLKFLSNQSTSKLRKLNLSACTRLTSAGLAPIRELAALEYLELNFSCLNDAAIAHIMSCSKLRGLSLEFSDLISTNGLKELALLPNLQTLSLRHNDSVTDDLLVALKTAPALRELNLSFCTNISPQGLAQLTQFPHLKRINLRDSGLAPLDLRPLQQARPDLQFA